MSSLRNAVKRITHKERSQPVGHHHGLLLERKKDYRIRATDYHGKQDRLRAMQQRAAMRNPDEFYFGMQQAVVDTNNNGRHRRTAEAERQKFAQEVGVDTIRIMKDQDLSYVRMQQQKDAKKVEQLKSSLHFLHDDDATTDNNSKRKHTVFVGSTEAAEHFTVAQHFDTHPALADRAYNRPRLETLRKSALVATAQLEDDDDKPAMTRQELRLQAKQTRKNAKKAIQQARASYREMRQRELRLAALQRAAAHLETEKMVASKGRKRKIKEAQNGQPAQYKWKRKRLR